MTTLVADCPRCGSKKITFDVLAQKLVRIEYDWQTWHEVFLVCRHCERCAVALISLKSIIDGSANFRIDPDSILRIKSTANAFFDVSGFISLKDRASVAPPEHLPSELAAVFKEAATCHVVECYNAAGTMFRLCLDLATRPLLPEGNSPLVAVPNSRQRRDLASRLDWLFENKILPVELKELAKAVREDGNDAAHTGNLSRADTEDLLDFSVALLTRLYTEPKRIAFAEARRAERRK
jgi:hypothetical protein